MSGQPTEGDEYEPGKGRDASAATIEAIKADRDEPKKPHYLPPLAFYNLDRACAVINAALNGFGCFLVGSCGERRDFRDVDVRYVMRDEVFDEMFRGELRDSYWSLLSVAISSWLSRECGYAVDFQIQKMSHANGGKHEGRRNALGIRVEYPGEMPRYQGGSAKPTPTPKGNR